MASKSVGAFAILLGCLSTYAAEFRILHGACDNRVFQRNAKNQADVALEGAGHDGTRVEIRVTRRRGVIPGFDWVEFATVQRGEWRASLRGLPAGGPYRLELRSGGSMAVVEDVLVGDLWVLAGQSNMQGAGALAGATPPNTMVHSFDLADNWVVAEEPLHTLECAVDRVHWPLNAANQREKWEGERLRDLVAKRTVGAGLGLPFAVEMVKQTGMPVGLIPCAHGGTSMDEWSPEASKQTVDSLYGSMRRRILAAGGRVAGILWYQGEADAKSHLAPGYRTKMEALIAAVRGDAGRIDLPFYYVQIGRNVSNQNVDPWNSVQESQRKLEDAVPGVAMAASVDLDMEDGIHIGTEGLKLLGRRLANLANGTAQKGPRPIRIRTEGKDKIRVEFSGVNGRLTGEGRLAGFSVHEASGRLIPRIYRTSLDPAAGNSLILGYDGGKLPAGAMLAYGQGKDPYCNVRDEAGMALPVFSPQPIEKVP